MAVQAHASCTLSYIQNSLALKRMLADSGVAYIRRLLIFGNLRYFITAYSVQVFVKVVSLVVAHQLVHGWIPVAWSARY